MGLPCRVTSQLCVHLLNSSLILGVSTTVGFAAAQKEDLKMTKNDPKCKELWWECVPLAVETYSLNIQAHMQEV